jgi:hypothetical protein
MHTERGPLRPFVPPAPSSFATFDWLHLMPALTGANNKMNSFNKITERPTFSSQLQVEPAIGPANIRHAANVSVTLEDGYASQPARKLLRAHTCSVESVEWWVRLSYDLRLLEIVYGLHSTPRT